MKNSTGSSPKSFLWKVRKQTRALGTTEREKTSHSSLPLQQENYVIEEKRLRWDFSWGRSGDQYQIWNLSGIMEGEWGHQSHRHVENPGRTWFQKQQAVSMVVLNMDEEPKAWSETCCLSRREAERRDSTRREDLCSPTLSVLAMRPGTAGKSFSFPGWETSCAWEALACKKMYPHEHIFWNLNPSQPCSALTPCWQLHFSAWNRYFRGILPCIQEILLKSIWQTATSFQNED